LDPEADEIQEGQEEADEGLWLLWNNRPTDSLSSVSITKAQPPQQNQTIYGSSSAQGVRGSLERENNLEEAEEEESNQDDREDRLEAAKARAKHAEEYVAKNSRTCCCIIS
jgi:hypothetical protein